MNAAQIIAELKPLGLESYKKVILKHGVQEPCFGVKVEELKKIQKRIKQDYRLALELYDTGIFDAMYLAGLIADDKRMTKADLNRWLKNAPHEPLRSSTVPWVAAESGHGWELALEWIEAKDEAAAEAGWRTLGSLVAITPDANLDIAQLRQLIVRLGKTILKQPGGVRYAMNSCLIAVGTHVAPLTELALRVAGTIGPLEVDMGETSCKVPLAAEYIEKAKARGSIGKKRKSAKC
jgi:3-methyladenine DNA glycosylase AlkD